MTSFIPNQPGIFYGLSESVYRQAPGANISALKAFEETPLDYRHQRDNPTPSTKDQLLGQVLHQVTFRPQEPLMCAIKKQAMTPAERRRWESCNNDKPWLSVEEMKQVQGASQALLAHSLTRRMLHVGRGEVSVFAEDPETGILCKARYDWLCEDNNGQLCLPDLKFYAEVDEKSFKRKRNEYHLHAQAAFYVDLWTWLGLTDDVPLWLWVVVRKESPHHVRLYQPDEKTMAEGRRLYRGWLSQLKECQESDRWPGYPEVVEVLEL